MRSYSVLLPQPAGRDAFQGVHQFRQLHRGRVLDEEVDVVVFAVALGQRRAEVGADGCEHVGQ